MKERNARRKHAWNRILHALPAIFFGVSLLLSWAVAYSVSGNLLDSDASSELVLANLLFRQGRILTSDWFYSSELRVTSTNLLFAPLFAVFASWRTVRFAGIVLMQIILVASFGYLCRQTRIGTKAFFCGASFLVLPYSVIYGRIVLYHSYYLPFVAIGFLLTGQLLAAARRRSAARGPIQKAIPASLLFALSFVAGLNGIRPLMVTLIPLLAAALIQAHHLDALPEGGGEEPALPKWGSVGLAFGACCFGGGGYLVNSLYLSTLYSFTQYGAVSLAFANAERVLGTLLGYLSQYGFQGERPLLSLGGMLSIGGVFIACYLTRRSLRCLGGPSPLTGTEAGFIQVLFPAAILTMAAVFLFTAENGNYDLYMIPVAVWAIPLMATWLNAPPKAPVGRILLMTVCALLYGNSLYNCWFFLHPQAQTAIYQGLYAKDTDTVQNLRELAAYLREEEYTLGYATFWDANILTEMTDGEVAMVNIRFSDDLSEITYYDWLSNRQYRERDFVEQQKVFLLLKGEVKRDLFFETPLAEDASFDYEDEHYFLFAFDSPMTLWEAIAPPAEKAATP